MSNETTGSVDTLEPEPTAPRGRRPKRPRRPVRRLFIVTHRWLSLILGLVLLLITMSGAILVYKPEIQRALDHEAYRASDKPATVSLVEARELVLAAHPKFPATSVWAEHGVLRVTDYETSWTVDPGTGEILGHVSNTPSWLQLMDNIHECFFSCEDYTGYVAFFNESIPGTAWLGFDDTEVTYGGMVLGLLGLVLLYLCLTGIWLWFPRPGKWRGSMNVRWKRGRFARDTDLHNVAGMVALVFLLMWAITGAGYEFRFVEKAFYAATPGKPHAEVEAVSEKLPKGDKTPDISIEKAVAAAQALHPKDTLVNVDVPAKDDPTAAYTFYFSHGFDPWAESPYPGELGTYVDRHTGVAKDYYGFLDEPNAQVLWEDYNYPVHSGYVVNSWWRIIWLVMGLAPLLLAITGVSTWLVRRTTKKARKRAMKAGDVPPPVPGAVAEQLEEDPEQDPALAKVD